MTSEAAARRPAKAGSLKLQQDSAIVEDAATQLVKTLTLLDRAVKEGAPARELATRITHALLNTAQVVEKLCFELTTLLNEL
jgi:hypothetical protein